MVDFGNAIDKLSIQNNNTITTSSYIFIIPSILILTYGTYRLIKSKIDLLYKIWIVTAFLLLLAVLVYPRISETINYTRYYHMMLIFLAPAIIFTFKKWNVQITTIGIIAVFLFTSGLIFNLLKIDNISKIQLPYSIALENKKLDAGNYLTQSDRAVAKWASEQDIKEIHGDLGGVAALQDYFSLYQTHLLDGNIPSGYLFIREWNTEQGTLAYWVGPGLRIQKPLPEINRPILYRSGNSILYGVE
jgi:hypothetical protein